MRLDCSDSRAPAGPVFTAGKNSAGVPLTCVDGSQDLSRIPLPRQRFRITCTGHGAGGRTCRIFRWGIPRPGRADTNHPNVRPVQTGSERSGSDHQPTTQDLHLDITASRRKIRQSYRYPYGTSSLVKPLSLFPRDYYRNPGHSENSVVRSRGSGSGGASPCGRRGEPGTARSDRALPAGVLLHRFEDPVLEGRTTFGHDQAPSSGL